MIFQGCTCLRSALPLARARSAATYQGVHLSQVHQPRSAPTKQCTNLRGCTCLKCTDRAHECRLLCWCSWDSCTPWRMPLALLVQLRQLHPLKNAACFVGAAETAAPPEKCRLLCWCSGDRCTPWCLFQIGHKSEFCVFCGSWLLRSENFSKKTLWPSAKPHANIVQVSAAKKFILEKWKSCF